jgi:GxxExxY protein
MDENELAKIVVDTALQIHRRLGPGLLESAYHAILLIELRKRGLHVDREVKVPLRWDDVLIDVADVADLIVEQKLILELKSVEELHPVHKKQLLTYLKISDCRLGLLINFGAELIKDGIVRIANRLPQR